MIAKLPKIDRYFCQPPSADEASTGAAGSTTGRTLELEIAEPTDVQHQVSDMEESVADDQQGRLINGEIYLHSFI